MAQPNHLDLTTDERTAALEWWRDYVLSGGEGDPPSAFMLDALNDETVRDTFLFWHVGGDPFSEPGSAWGDNPLVMSAMETLGAHPTDYNKVVLAMTKAVEEVNASEPDLDTVDTATVLVLAHVILGMLLKKFDAAAKLLTDIIRINTTLLRKGEMEHCIHEGPLEAVAIALGIIRAEHDKGNHEEVEKMLTTVFSMERLPVLVNNKEGN
jgi:hypothetical protein